MYLGEQTIERSPLRNSTSREDERQKPSRDLRLFRPLMLISKIKDLYHLIELTNGTYRKRGALIKSYLEKHFSGMKDIQ